MQEAFCAACVMSLLIDLDNESVAPFGHSMSEVAEKY